jgi:hypothetical protein
VAHYYFAPNTVVQADDGVLIQTLFTQPAVETVDVRVLGRLTSSNELELYIVFMRPRFQRFAHEFRGVVDLYQARLAQSLEHPSEVNAGQRDIDFDARAFVVPSMNDRQHSHTSTVKQRV